MFLAPLCRSTPCSPSWRSSVCILCYKYIHVYLEILYKCACYMYSIMLSKTRIAYSVKETPLILGSFGRKYFVHMWYEKYFLTINNHRLHSHWSCKGDISSSYYFPIPVKNERELSFLHIWSFTYRRRAGDPEPRNWPELSLPTHHSESDSAPCNKVTGQHQDVTTCLTCMYCKQILFTFKKISQD